MSETFELGPLQKQWVAALRSGEYRQCRAHLAEIIDDKEHNCCLGVGCRIVQKSGVTLPVWEMVLDGKRCLSFRGNFARLPLAVEQALRFRSQAGRIQAVKLNGEDSLDKANDNGATFAEIADFVEANPSAVFTGPA